jgi:glycerol-3-phosphate cytidylyltransferase
MLIGFYPMVGDLLHAGHLLAIEEAKQNCDYLIVGLNCNPANKNPI